MSNSKMPKRLTANVLLAPAEDFCGKCSSSLMWVECWNCGGEGYSDHDCGEDCCACLHPEDNVRCDICRGKGGWKACMHCNPGAFDNE